MSQRVFGRIVVPDDRDHRFSIEPRKTSRVSRFWEDELVLDQGSTSSCVGQAWSHWLSSPPIEQFLRPLGIYDVCKFFDEWEGEEYDGTSVRAGAKILKMLGLISEYRWATSIDALAYSVLEEGPVVVGTDWYEGMDNGGVLKATGRILGGHAWLIDGVNTETKMFRMKNSWGKDWGDQGRALVPFDQMQILLSSNGEVCLGIESAASLGNDGEIIVPPSPSQSWIQKLIDWILGLFKQVE